MDIKQWFKPKVLIAVGVGVALALLIAWFSLTKGLTAGGCPSSTPLSITLSSTADNPTTWVCAGQVVRWTSAKQFTVEFHPGSTCTTSLKYPLNQSCGTNPNCSQLVTITQPSWVFGWCDYDIADGLVDPRIIVIGK
jgi:hypothetical protein